jgi:membrane protease YdiL (CAAX protease family)
MRMLGFTALLGLATLVFHPYGAIVKALSVGKPSNVTFLIQLVFGFLLGIVFVVVVWLVVRVEKPRDWKGFLKVGPPDLTGMFLFYALGTITYLLNASFLQYSVWDPIQHYLESLGLPGEQMSASISMPDYRLSSGMALIVLIGLLLVSWVEAPEEFFFRGYVQNQLQGLYGKIAAVLLGALIWDAMHLFAPANFVERFFLGVCVQSLVFALRQNVTPLAIMHPLDNRAGLMAFVFLQIFGVVITDANEYWLVSNASLCLLALAVYVVWTFSSRRGKSTAPSGPARMRLQICN